MKKKYFLELWFLIDDFVVVAVVAVVVVAVSIPSITRLSGNEEYSTVG